MPVPQRLSAPVVQTVRRRRLVDGKPRVVFGTLLAIAHVLAPRGGQINTAFVERLTLDIRQQVAAVGRRVITRCQGEDGLRQQRALSQTSHNFCLPHGRFRQPLAQPEPTNGPGSTQPGRPCPPAMAAGLTARGWTLRERFLCRVPPWPQPQALSRDGRE